MPQYYIICALPVLLWGSPYHHLWHASQWCTTLFNSLREGTELKHWDLGFIRYHTPDTAESAISIHHSVQTYHSLISTFVHLLKSILKDNLSQEIVLRWNLKNASECKHQVQRNWNVVCHWAMSSLVWQLHEQMQVNLLFTALLAIEVHINLVWYIHGCYLLKSLCILHDLHWISEKETLQIWIQGVLCWEWGTDPLFPMWEFFPDHLVAFALLL
jgi:hypothetical protein